jgi:hypothetical protein
MRVRGGVVAFAIGFLISLRADADTVWAPLMGHIVGGGAGRPWFSETRVINPNLQPATVTVTDTVGIGDPPGSVSDLVEKGKGRHHPVSSTKDAPVSSGCRRMTHEEGYQG